MRRLFLGSQKVVLALKLQYPKPRSTPYGTCQQSANVSVFLSVSSVGLFSKVGENVCPIPDICL